MQSLDQAVLIVEKLIKDGGLGDVLTVERDDEQNYVLVTLCEKRLVPGSYSLTMSYPASDIDDNMFSSIEEMMMFLATMVPSLATKAMGLDGDYIEKTFALKEDTNA